MSKVITILLPDENPNGVKIVELANFAGKAFVIPRGKLKDIKNREEVVYPSVYFLFGVEEGGGRQVYIGETEKLFQRLTSHDSKKDFWNMAVAFVGNYDRADVKYLENQSVSLAKEIDRYQVLNEVEPLENRLSESKKVVADDSFEIIKFILGFLGLTLFQGVPPQEETYEMYYFKTDKSDAKGRLLDSGEFIVYAESTARIAESKSFERLISSFNLRRRLIKEGILKIKNKVSFEFARDYIFISPSAASDTVAGRSSNGWTSWKDEKRKTLDENKRK